jgi:molybdopterin-guanine dinucleotide biosynthesis protein A
MGRPKSLLRINGKTILDFLLDRVAWPGPTLLVTSPGCEHPPGANRFDREATDEASGEGPLRGVLTALEHTSTELLAVVGVDMIAVRGEDVAWYVERLAERPDALGVMASSREGLEPLPCGLRLGAREIVKPRVEEGRRSLRGLTDDPRVCVLDGAGLGPHVWMNANTPQEWDQVTGRLND